MAGSYRGKLRPGAGGGGWFRGQWTVFVVLAFLGAVFFAWQGLAKVDFLYPFWYDVIGIDETIAEYGPRNRHRRHFELTTKAERVRLFAAIVDAVQHQGRGLETLRYHNPAGRSLGRLLTEPEIVHLQDVARLIDRLRPVGWAAVIAASLLAGWLFARERPMPPARQLVSGVLVVLAGAALGVVLMGPVKVFYGLHTWVFPPGHAWFFYYQDSLMTMLMKAPDLFGYIALTLVVVSLTCLLVMLWLTSGLFRRFSGAVPGYRDRHG